MDWVSSTFELMIPIVAIISSFLFVGVVIWMKQRRSERDSFYRHELVKKMAERSESEAQLIEFIREEARIRQGNRKQGLMIGGLVTLAIGISYMVAFWIFLGEGLWALGAIPAAIGLALLLSGVLFDAKPDPES